jgi:hypothetical protein
MRVHPEDPAWHHYADTVLHFAAGPSIDLRREVAPADAATFRTLGLYPHFAVITAYNPGGRVASDAQNRRRHAALLAGMRLRVTACVEVAGASPDGRHREPGVAVRLAAHVARELAQCYHQSAWFWFDGSRFEIRGARVATPPIPLPVRD